MQRAVLPLLECPYDRGSGLGLTAPDVPASSEEIQEGVLRCTSCGRCYPILDGIACILPDELRTTEQEPSFRDEHTARVYAELSSARPLQATVAEAEQGDAETRFKVSEMRARDTRAPQLQATVGRYTTWAEPRLIASRLRIAPGDHVLDIGAGIGRLVPLYQGRCQLAVAADLSLGSLQTLRRNAAPRGELPDLVQADASHLPFAAQQFDKIVCSGMVHHIPTEGARRRAVSQMARTLRSGGRAVVTVAHHRNWLRRRVGWSGAVGKERVHSGGAIRYVALSPRDLRELLEGPFRVEELRGIINHWPLSHRLPAALRRGIHRVLEQLPLSERIGDELLAVARKR
jgi:SAM-dependent methyltransferase/uncharacterized protein YbaR (Trm112 family)